jgi:hypothetical protein
LAAGVPVRIDQLTTLVAGLTLEQRAVLVGFGVDPESYPAVALAVDLAVTAFFFAVSALICWRRSGNPIAIAVSAVLLGLAIWISPTVDALLLASPLWATASNIAQAIGWGATMGVLYIFPDGRFVPRWARAMIAVLGLVVAVWVLVPSSPFNFADRFRLPFVSFLLLIALVLASVAAQIYRFLVSAGPVQRQQTKWVLFGIALQVLGFAIFGVGRAILLSRPDSGTSAALELIGAPVALLFAVFIPLGYLFSILRYRLWDIDFLINQALVYGALTAILSGLYIASVGFTQRLFVALSGNRSEAAVVLSTLVVAAAFTPVKNRLQSLAGRYFKEPADPMRRVKDFRDQARTLAEMLDPERFVARALTEAAEAFEASAGAIYLRRDGELRPVQKYGDWTGYAEISCGLEAHGQAVGTIALAARRSGRAYTTQDRETLKNVADEAAAVLTLFGGNPDEVSPVD